MSKKITFLAFVAAIICSTETYSMSALFGDPSEKKCLANGTDPKKCELFARRVKQYMKKGWSREKAEEEVAKEMRK